MKNFTILILLLTFGLCLAQNGPKIEFLAADNTIDYGNVFKDEDSGIRFFEFKNTGNAPLIITNVLSTCGCTVPSKPTEPILPGKNGKIEVKYNMSPGAIRKTITVESNAINYPEGKIILKLKGEVLVKEIVNPLAKKKPMMSN